MKRGTLAMICGVLGLMLGIGVKCCFMRAAEEKRRLVEIETEKKDYAADSFMAMVKANLSGDWKVTCDDSLLVATMGEVKYFTTISAPTSPPTDERGWALAESRGDTDTGDFIIQIRMTSLMSDEEYRGLRKLREELLDTRIGSLKGDPRNGKAVFSSKMRVNEMLPLPVCHDEHSTYYLSSSDDGVRATWPASALQSAEALRAVLGSKYTLYRPLSERERAHPGDYDPAGGFD